MKPNKEYDYKAEGARLRAALEASFAKLGVLVEVSNGLGLMTDKEAKECKEVMKCKI